MWLIVRSGDAQGKTESVTGDLLIGRDETCDFVIPDEKVSRRHAYLKIHDEGGLTLQDLGSANGTWVDGMRISGVVTLKGTEELKFGDTLVGLTQKDPAAPADQRFQDPRIGTTIAGRYKIESVLAPGGMGMVYLAQQTEVGREVALKILSSRLAADERFRQRFESEWKTAASLRHPNILQVFDAGVSDGDLYIVMPYIEGGDLAKLIEEKGALEPDEALKILSQIASALDAAHALPQALVHRDVKPANILIASGQGGDSAGHAYLCDFGISKSTSSGGFTMPGEFPGTPDYMAPEQIKGTPVDGRTDEYALGCVLFECLTGRVPFERNNDEAVRWAQVHEPPPKATEIRSQLPPAIDAVIAKALAKAPEERYATSTELISAARAALAGEPAAEPVPPTRATVIDPTLAAAPAPAPVAPVSSKPTVAEGAVGASTLPPTTPEMAVSKETVAGVPEAGAGAAAASVPAAVPPASWPPPAPTAADAPATGVPRPDQYWVGQPPPQGGQGGPPLVPKASRGPLLLVAGILVLVLVAGGYVVLTKSGKKGAVSPTSPSVVRTTGTVPTTPSTTPPTTPTTTPPTTLPPAEFPNTEEAILLQHIPKAFRGTCDRLEDDSVPSSALAAVICFPFTGADEAHYIQFANVDSMFTYYQDRVFQSPVLYGFDHRANCDQFYNEEGRYPPTGSASGRVLCYITPGNSRPFFEWTDNGCFVYAWAVRTQDKNAVELTNWWDDVKKSGPIGC
jgi:hypothetical protein